MKAPYSSNAGSNPNQKTVYGVGIYKGTKRCWKSIAECVRKLGSTEYMVKSRIKNGKDIHGFILSYKETK